MLYGSCVVNYQALTSPPIEGAATSAQPSREGTQGTMITAPTPADAVADQTSKVPTDQVSDFGTPATDGTIDRAVEALRGKGYAVHVVEDAAAARNLVVELLPEGAEVSQGASETLEHAGITAEIEHSGRYDAVRPKTRAMDRTTPEGLRAMRKLGVGPDWYVNSIQAVTEDGTFVGVSNTGSQLAPLAFGAGRIIFVIGSQKIVPDVNSALRRIDEHVLPLENKRMQGIYGVDSEVKKILIIRKETRPERITVILVKEPIGA